ncbi:chromosome-associated kinesin KIF4-like, partial [Sitophilus oryzae]|uniref:Chromosome-associated kinesin KIF4-like n=1 Tax=Sitophilus oryzae TaxID=7048 RepID=A0A6J2YV25_SITOR
ELAKVKEQGRKKQNEIAKMKLTYEKQKNVLKRKFEEAAALNKRLQNTFNKRKEAQEIRFNGKVEKIAAWLKDDFEVFLSLVEAETALTGLLEDRATLYHQLDELKNNPETAGSPEVKNLEEDIELRSVQIQDLQQKLLDSNEEVKSKRVSTIQSMARQNLPSRPSTNRPPDHWRGPYKGGWQKFKETHKELIEK